MAIINGTSAGGMTLQADYSYTQNTSANTTTVTVTLKLANHYALYASALSGSYISVGGNKTNYSKSISYGGSTTTTTTLATKTVTVTHNSDGTGSCAISGTFVMNGSYRGSYVGTMSVSSTITLPQIARASGLTVPSSVNTGSALSGTIIPSSTAFNHKVQLKIGSTIKDTISLAVGTKTFSYTVPHSWLPNSTSGTITVVLQTYNGTSLVASVSKNVTANVPSNIAPSISWFGVNGTSNTLGGLYVQGKTTAQLSTSVVAGGGAGISSYTYSGPDIYTTTESYTINTGTIQSYGTLTYTVSVKDTRGRTASASTQIYVYPYNTPTIGSVAVQRCASDGTISDSGTYARYTVNSAYATVGGKNTRTVTVAFSSNNGSSYSSETTIQTTTDTNNSKTGTYGTGAFALASTYLIRFTIKDAYGATHSVTAPLNSAARPINIRSNGKGVAIGGMSTKDAFEVSMPSEFNNNVIAKARVNVDGTLTTNYYIDAKESIHMGGMNGQTKELQVRFSNPTNSANPHNCYLYGGNPNSPTAIGLYDSMNSRGVLVYSDANNHIALGNGGATILFNGNKMDNFVVDENTSGAWTYRKWNDGRMDVYGTVSHNPTVVNDGINSITVTLPVSFANSEFTVIVTPAKCGLLVSRFGDCSSNNNITHTNNSFVLSYRYDHGQIYTVNFNVMLTGKWK